jgi:polysaccharide chain length determinant protein (PEP-CTERM system associated)
MIPVVDTILDEARGAWRFRWPAVWLAWAVALLGWAYSFALRDVYQAQTSVFVDTRTALRPVLQGLAVEQDTSAELSYVRQSLLAGPQLEELALNTGVLKSSVTDAIARAEQLEAFRDRIRISSRSAAETPSQREQETAGSIYNIEYKDGSRERSMAVVDGLLTALIEKTLGGKREGSADAEQFLKQQVADYEQRLREAEARLATFKKGNVGLLPTEQGGYFNQLQSEISMSKKAESDLSVAMTKRNELSRQLRGDSVVSATAVSMPSMPGGGGDTLSRIKDAQIRLDDLLLRFTDKHPEVQAMRETLAELQRRREAEVQALRRGDSNAVASSGASANPVYQSIQLALNQTDVEIASLRGQLAMHRGKVDELRRMLDTMPQVEADYAQLTRDYDVNRLQYTQLLERLQKARIGEDAASSGSVRFQVVQPVTAPVAPVSPRRALLIVGTLLVAVLAGAGLAVGLHRLKPVFSSARQLARDTGLELLGVVSVAFPQRNNAVLRADSRRLAAVGSGLLMAFAVVFILYRFGVHKTMVIMLRGEA